jgi:KDO2-lipid IV(A) lauroyltransferase
MDKLIYFFQFLVIIFLFTLFKLIGFKYSSIFSGCLATLIGPVFRSKSVIDHNINRALPKFTAKEKNKLIKKMWTNYGKILSDYVFLKNFRIDQTFKDKIKIINGEILEQIKEDGRPVIFVSGHFNNFELMAMSIEKSGINLAAVYRPLNNPFLNPLMEKIRKKYLCKNQIKKGIAGTKELLKHFKKNNSIALMIDQRVSEGT